MKGYFSKLFL